MLFYLLLLFTVVPLTEFAILYWIGERIGLLATIGLVLGTGILGAALARWQGTLTLYRMRRELSQGQLPAEALFDSVLILVAAALLITPGVLTDAVGFSLLVPQVRTFVKKLLRRWFALRVGSRFYAQRWTAAPTRGDRIIDVEVVESRPSDVDAFEAQTDKS